MKFGITLKPEQPFAFAELWEHCQRGERVVESCTIIVTVANDLTRDIHDRLPT